MPQRHCCSIRGLTIVCLQSLHSCWGNDKNVDSIVNGTDYSYSACTEWLLLHHVWMHRVSFGRKSACTLSSMSKLVFSHGVSITLVCAYKVTFSSLGLKVYIGLVRPIFFCSQLA